MHNNLLVVNRYSCLTRQLELYDPTYTVNDNVMIAAAYRFLNQTNQVHLFSGDQYHLVGYVYDIQDKFVTVDLLNNSFGAFVQRMLYHAVDYRLVARGLGQVSHTTNSLLGFKINTLFITDYTKWF